MEVKVSAKHIRISPRKVRLVIDAIRGMEAQKALNKLKFINKKATKPVAKLLSSAVANAEHNHEIEKDNLKISEIRVDEGPTIKRWMPRAHGRATAIRKRTSHITLTVSEIVVSKEAKTKKQKIAAPVKLGTQPKGEKSVKVSGKDKKGKDKKSTPEVEDEKGKVLVDPRSEGKGKNAKIEGKGFSGKMFRRKSG